MRQRFGVVFILLTLLFVFWQSFSPTVAQPAAFAPVPTFTPTPKPAVLATPVSPPQVVAQQQRYPTRTDRHQLWWLVFDRPMDQASVEAALTIEPTLDVKLRWVNQTLYVEPQSALRPGAHYTFTLQSTATDQNGVALSKAYIWRHNLPTMLGVVSWPTEQQRAAPIALTFNYAMDLASVAAALVFSPPIAGEWHWDNDHTTLTLTPSEPLLASGQYTLTFAGELRDAQGEPLPSPAALTFTAPAALISLGDGASSYVDPRTPVVLHFDRPLDQASATAAFTLTPPISGTVTWQGTDLIFTPARGYLAENTQYTVSLAPTVRDQAGRPILAGAYTGAFQTTELARPAKFRYGGADIQLLDSAGRRAVHFQLNGQSNATGEVTTTLDFALYRLDQQQFITRFSQAQPGHNQWRKEPIAYTGLELTKRWSLTADLTTTQAGPTVREVQIPADVAPGLYILNVGASPLDDQLFLVITHHVLMLKAASDQLTAWLTAINDASVAAAEVTFYDRQGRLLGQGVTDETGLFQSPLPPAAQPALVFARVGADLTVAGLDSQWRHYNNFGPNWWQPAPTTSANAIYIYTDRPIYRPGQSVYFKAMVRSDDDADLSLLPLNTPITVTLRDARNNAVQTQVLATNDFGTVHGAFQLADGAMLGEYAIELQINGERHRQIFKVEEYHKPDYRVTVTPNTQRYVAGETVTIAVTSRYFYDAPTAQASVTVKQYQLGPRNWWATPADEAEYTWFDYGIPEQRGQIDAAGHFTFTLPATVTNNNFNSDWQSSLHRDLWGIEVTVDDGSHQTVSGFAVITVVSAHEKIGLAAGAYIQTAGQPFTLPAQATTLDDGAVAGRNLTLRLQRASWEQNQFNYSDDHQFTAVTDATGRANFPITLGEPGYYEVKLAALDAQGQAMEFSSWLLVVDNAAAWAAYSSGDPIRLHADRTELAPGDTAHLQIETRNSGPALLTFERGRTRRTQLIQLTPPLTAVDVPIQAADAPNIFVTVNTWQAQDTQLGPQEWASKPDSRLVSASVNLRVPPQHKQLAVTITPSQTHYAPRDTATFTVTVRNAAGQPVAAELAVALVDEAIFSLSQELAGPIFAAFYRARPNLVQTYDGLAPIRWFGGMGGGGGGPAPTNPRSNFPDTARWLPVVRTDGAGQAVITVTLPDSLTTWRLTAKAITAQETQVGEAAITVVTQQPLVVRPLLPTLLTVGDQAELAALVQNESDQPRALTVSLQFSPTVLLALSSRVTQTLTLAPHETGIVGWSVQARAAGAAALVVVASAADGLSDAVRLPLPIQDLALPNRQSLVGEFRGDFSTPITLPGASLASSRVTVEVNRSVAGSLLNGLEYLTGYPYGCVEQTMSRALPNAVVGRALRQLGLPSPALHAELPALVDAGLQRLYGFQHNDGGWGWWHDDNSDFYQTAWVLFGLQVTQEAGYAVEPAVIKRGADWLRASLPDLDPRTRAYALYSLAVAGYGDLPATRALLKQVDQLDTFSQAALALALHSLGLDQAAETLVDQLAAGAVVRDGQAFWPNAQEDGHYYQKTMASTTRTTALMLSALTRIRPGHPRIAESVRWLMAQRQGAGWGTTNETAYAILGLTDHFLAQPEANASTRYRIELNGATISRGVLDRQQARAQLTISAAQLRAGVNQLRLVGEDESQLYYVITQRIALAQRQLAAAGKVQVERTYLAADSQQPLTHFAPGQLVKVQVRVTVPESAFYVIVEDKLPGGLEALNERLNTTSHVADPYGGEPVLFWQEYGYNYKEVRDGRVSFFITELPAGTREFTYLARATHAGEFTALPAEAYAMYEATMWGRSASTQLVVQLEPRIDKLAPGKSAIWYMTNRADGNPASTTEWRTKTLPQATQFEQPVLDAVEANLLPYFTGEWLGVFEVRERFSPYWRYAIAVKTDSDLGERQPHWMLTLIDLESGVTRPLVAKASQYAWSPDEQQIAYVYDHTLYTLQLDPGSQPVPLFTHPELTTPFLQWSPDGHWLATTTMHEGMSSAANNYPYTQTVWLVGTHDGATRQLATAPAVGRETVAQEMAWSSDSQSLVFQGEILGLAGSQVKLADAGAVNSWLPNRQQLLVSGSNGLRIVDRSGQEQLRVSDQPTHFLERAFSHDGTRLAYTKHHYAQEQSDLWVFDLTTGQNEQITTLPSGCITRVRWSMADDVLIAGGCSPTSSIWVVPAQPGQTSSVLVDHGFLLEVIPTK